MIQNQILKLKPIEPKGPTVFNKIPYFYTTDSCSMFNICTKERYK